MNKVNDIRASVSPMYTEKGFEAREGHDPNLDVHIFDS
jgi:hypothetical protein